MSGREGTPGSLLERRVWVSVVGTVGFAVVAGLLVPWDWVPGGDLVPVRASALFTPAELSRMETYSWAARITGWFSLAVSLVLALLLGLTRSGAWIVRRAGRRWLVQVVVGTGALLLLERLATLPFAWQEHRLARDYALSNQATGPWLVDVGKGLAVQWVAMSLLLLAVIGIARWRSHTWHVWAAAAAGLLVVAGSFAYPLLVEPLFNNFRSLPDGPLRSEIFHVAQRDGLALSDVLVADASRRTTTLNAYVSGFGSSRRVVVYDNTLDDLDRRQVLEVVAHELTHAREHDVLLGTGLGALGAVTGIGLLAWLLDLGWVRRRGGFDSAGDPAAVAAILAALAVATVLASPVQSTVSRAIEARADRGALISLGPARSAPAFVGMQRQLALRSLSDPRPPALSQVWFGSHPTVLQRVGLALALSRGRG